ncbi:MAG TPA: periplasmic heavy metal sensor [Thermoanaerobaculia bacterium]|nr:periplasmic heavy metal sensor [Thermoanaerobaculia bacterium]
MSKRNVILIASLAIIALTGIPFLYAQHARGMHGGMHGCPLREFGFGRLERAKQYLDLSDAQTDQLKTIVTELRAQNAPYRQQVRGGMLQVAQTLINNPNNVTAAQALLDRQNAAEQTLKANTLAAAAKALAVLTPDQRAKVADFIAKRAAMHNQQ